MCLCPRWSLLSLCDQPGPQLSIQTGCQRGAGGWGLPGELWGLPLAPLRGSGSPARGTARPAPSAPVPRSQPPGLELGMEGAGIVPVGALSPREGKRAAVKITPGPAPAHCGFLRFTALPGGKRQDLAGSGLPLTLSPPPEKDQQDLSSFFPAWVGPWGGGLWWAPSPERPPAPWGGCRKRSCWRGHGSPAPFQTRPVQGTERLGGKIPCCRSRSPGRVPVRKRRRGELAEVSWSCRRRGG